ncbi:7601_t:CDS:1, partial [Cetraspora pellucida]
HHPSLIPANPSLIGIRVFTFRPTSPLEIIKERLRYPKFSITRPYT